VRSRIWIVSAAAVLISGCGYTLAGRGSFLPDTIRTIGIPTFANDTPLYQAEQVLTEKVRTEFIGRGKYKVLPQDTGVDAVLRCEITSIKLQPAAFTGAQQASKYTIMLSAKIEFRDLKADKILWQNPNLVFHEEYDAPSRRRDPRVHHSATHRYGRSRLCGCCWHLRTSGAVQMSKGTSSKPTEPNTRPSSLAAGTPATRCLASAVAGTLASTPAARPIATGTISLRRISHVTFDTLPPNANLTPISARRSEIPLATTMLYPLVPRNTPINIIPMTAAVMTSLGRIASLTASSRATTRSTG
jgi:outer membrane lipopolysaccharide assembly protein LptE/RlpB